MRREDIGKFLHTDLAYEQRPFPTGKNGRKDGKEEKGENREKEESGVTLGEEKNGDVLISRMSILNASASKRLGRPVGEYVTVSFPPLCDIGEEEEKDLIGTISRETERLCVKNCPGGISGILVAGLGNRMITSDALGPFCASGIGITRHVPAETRSTHPEISAISPGVLSQTGIETLELIKGAVNASRPSAVIVVDALAAKSVYRLARTVQLTDTGITPGSGIGNHRRTIARDELGVPVIAVGVPTVVDSATLVLDALERAGVEFSSLPDSMNDVLKDGESFFVTLKDSDTAVERMSGVISSALNNFFERIAPVK